MKWCIEKTDGNSWLQEKQMSGPDPQSTPLGSSLYFSPKWTSAHDGVEGGERHEMYVVCVFVIRYIDTYILKVNDVPYPKKTYNAHWNKLTQNLVILIFSEYGLFVVNTHMGSQSLFNLNKRICVLCFAINSAVNK